MLEFIPSMPDWAVRAKVGSHEYSFQAAHLKGGNDREIWKDCIARQRKQREVYFWQRKLETEIEGK